LAIEKTRVVTYPKPWGVSDLMPWSSVGQAGVATGEIWYERSTGAAGGSALLLKLLFTSAPLSIQVHPDDAYARANGLASGKSEAWYVLSAAPGAKVGLGLKQPTALKDVRKAVIDGSIADLVDWRAVAADDVIFVPAGTIHAIGAGLIVAEIQQRSDATFRMFDHGRLRELHVEQAMAVATTGPADFQVRPNRLTDERTLLLSTAAFEFERIELAPGVAVTVNAPGEMWLLVLGGAATASSHALTRGDGLFAEADRIDVRAGNIGFECLVAYAGTGGPLPRLLERAIPPASTNAQRPDGTLKAGLSTAVPARPFNFTPGRIGNIS
jgi:mannose-6-phosphate isomerase